jgi:hypothetical protein
MCREIIVSFLWLNYFNVFTQHGPIYMVKGRIILDSFLSLKWTHEDLSNQITRNPKYF